MKTLIMTLFVVSNLTACGTLTGIPAHGGGKRFATEQRLVSASIRSSLKDIDVSPLKGKKVALIFDIVADEGGGTMSGGRLNILGAATSGYLMSPLAASSSAFQLFNLADSGTSYTNSSNSGSSIANTAFMNNSANRRPEASGTTSSGTSNSSNQSTDSSNTSANSQSKSNSTSQQSSNGTNASTTATNGTSVAGTSNTTFNQTEQVNGQTSQTATSSGSDTAIASQSSNTTSSSNGSSASSNSQNSSSTGNSNDIGQQDGTSTQRNTNADAGSQTGGSSRIHQEISPQPSYTQSQTHGNQKTLAATLDYKGLGEYQNFSVPKSDASLLMGLTRNYLLLNGVEPTAPTDEAADALLYVSVDIFGIVRSRFDAYVYNQESLKAETSFEMMAFDRDGKLILKPTNANREAQYAERYLFWAGPYKTDEKVKKGKGLLVDFSDVDGNHATYGKDEIRASYSIWEELIPNYKEVGR